MGPLIPLMLQLNHAKLLDVLMSLHESYAIFIYIVWFVMFVCLFDLILYIPSTIFQLNSLPGLNQY